MIPISCKKVRACAQNANLPHWSVICGPGYAGPSSRTSETRAELTVTTVLFKLKPGVTPGQLSELVTAAKGMVGKVPGLRKLEANTPHPSTAHRGQGFNMGLVAILEKADDIKVYADHPAHLQYVNRVLFLVPTLDAGVNAQLSFECFLDADTPIEFKTLG